MTDAFNQIMDTGLNIDAVVHGAGSEESKPLSKKTSSLFDGYTIQSPRGSHFWTAYPHPHFSCLWAPSPVDLEIKVKDYSAANDAVGYICQQRSNFPHLLVTSTEVGMASRGGMDHLLTQRGIQLLPLEFAVDQAIG